MYYLSPEGKRIYTLKKISPSGRPTVSAHPARFSPDDKYSRHRITCKRRYGLLPTQKPATQYWNFLLLLLLLLLLLHPTFSTFTSSRLRLANRTWISSRSIPSSSLMSHYYIRRLAESIWWRKKEEDSFSMCFAKNFHQAVSMTWIHKISFSVPHLSFCQQIWVRTRLSLCKHSAKAVHVLMLWRMQVSLYSWQHVQTKTQIL